VVTKIIEMTEQLGVEEKSKVLPSAERKRKTSRKKESLDDLLVDVIDETLKYVFQEAGAEAIYGYLERNYYLKREDVADKTGVFSAGLKRLLGSGAPVIEGIILNKLYHRFHLKYEKKRYSGFPEYIKELRKTCGLAVKH
jgi:hypothetical protein